VVNQDVNGTYNSWTQRSFLKSGEICKKMGLVINQEKTVYMYSGKDTTLYQDLSIGNYVFKRVDNFKYLGTMVNEQQISRSERSIDNG